MRGSLFLAVALALGAGVVTAIPDADAQSRRAVRQTAEGSMVLTGQINIGTEGQVEGFVLDDEGKVASDLAAFVNGQVLNWRFEPIVRDGAPVRARTYASIRLVAKAVPDGRDAARIQAASFERYDPEASDSITKISMKPPVFPSRAVDMRGSGEVMLLMRVGRAGTVTDVVAEQVNLRVVGDESQMQRLRDSFAKASIAAARNWTFRLPTTGDYVDAADWTVRVPVDFAYTDEKSGYGQWSVYIPGPRARAPWREQENMEEDLAGLLATGGVYMADAKDGPRLLTPLGG